MFDLVACCDGLGGGGVVTGRVGATLVSPVVVILSLDSRLCRLCEESSAHEWLWGPTYVLMFGLRRLLSGPQMRNQICTDVGVLCGVLLSRG